VSVSKSTNEPADSGMECQMLRFDPDSPIPATTCNPETPAYAMAVLRDECTNVIVDIKKSWPEQFLDDVVWPVLS
jgi:hypothetical protein